MSKKENVLIIGDIHAPFTLKEYLDHCKEAYRDYNCTRVVLIGDLIDNHYPSYHETDPNGRGGQEELRRAIKEVQKWYKAFPNAVVTIGNHDRIVHRKAFSSGVPKEWVRDFQEVLNTPNWDYVTEVFIDGVRYVHGDKSSKPRTAAKRDMISTVSGHFHTDMYVEHFYGLGKHVFACAVGCGIDDQSYAMGYMSGGKKAALGCSVVFGGVTAVNVPMLLTKRKRK
jgi:metallophosphoesterase superfamily enzyme